MKRMNIISFFKDIKTIYPQAEYDKSSSTIEIPILHTEAFLNDDIDIVVSELAVRCRAGLEDITYYYDENDTESDVIKKINEIHSFVEMILKIIIEEIKDKI